MGKAKAKIRAVIPILLLVIIPVGYVLVVSELRVITTPPEELFIGVDAFPNGWAKTYFVVYEYHRSGVNWSALMQFSNNTLPASENAIIGIISYNSTSQAHNEYINTMKMLGTIIPTNKHLGDEGFFISSGGSEPNPGYAGYFFRENNIIVSIEFTKYSPTDRDQPNPYQPWMDDVAGSQASMIR